MLSRGWIDVSAELGPHTPSWPGDPRFERELLASHDADGVEVSALRMSLHTGTHIDAPAHYVADGPRLGDLPFDATMGPCVVIDAGGVERIDAAWLENLPFAEGERVLFRTANSTRRLLHHPQFTADYVHLTPDAAQFLVERHARCVGIDYLSIGGNGDDGVETHRILLSSGVWIIEGLDLSGIDPGAYELLCLPLNIPDGEAAPARALLRPPKTRPDGEIEFIDDAVEWASKTG